MRDLVQEVLPHLSLSYDTKVITNAINMTAMNCILTELKIYLWGHDHRILSSLFTLCITNFHPTNKYKHYEHKYEHICNILRKLKLNIPTEEELVYGCSPDTQINIRNPDSLIPFLASQLYNLIFDYPSTAYINTNSPNRRFVDELTTALHYLTQHMDYISIICGYFQQMQQSIGITSAYYLDAKTHITGHEELFECIPLYFITSEHKQYVAELFFTDERGFNTHHQSDDSMLKYINAALHIYTLTDFIKQHQHNSSPDEVKLIAIYPLQNKFIKFYHSPIISDLIQL